ncbi:hypothetical protein KR009_007273 [Drosophila setifemur]|nr:hypothetical protein KR009_007273 [Drosophila setifemur]
MHDNTELNGDREAPNQDELGDFGWELRIVLDDELDEELQEQQYQEQEEEDEEEVQDEEDVEEDVEEVEEDEEVEEELPRPEHAILVDKEVQTIVSSLSDKSDEDPMWALKEIQKIIIQSTNKQMSEHMESERRTMRTRRRALLKVLPLEDILMRQLAAEEQTDVKLAKDQMLENILKDHIIWLEKQLAELRGVIKQLRECRRDYVTLPCLVLEGLPSMASIKPNGLMDSWQCLQDGLQIVNRHIRFMKRFVRSLNCIMTHQTFFYRRIQELNRRPRKPSQDQDEDVSVKMTIMESESSAESITCDSPPINANEETSFPEKSFPASD